MNVRQPLYNKYRPSRFSEVVGQELLVKFIRNAVKQGKHPNGWLIHGSFGSGKTTIARLYAKALLCRNTSSEGDPCGSCESCLSVDRGSHPNYIEEDSASNSKVVDIERVLKDCYDLPAGGDKFKIVVLDECHIISSTGQSKLLKTLEEGLPHIIFILLTTDVEKIIDTIQSRLQKVPVSTVSFSSITSLLERVCVSEGIVFEVSALEIIAKKSKGHIRDSLTFLDQIASLGDISEERVREHFLEVNTIRVCSMLEKVSSDTHGALDILEDLCTRTSAQGIKTLMLEVINASSKFKYYKEVGILTEEMEYYKKLFKQYGDSLFNMFHFINNEACFDYFSLENLVMILGAYTKDTVVYSAKKHVETKKDGYSNKARQKSYRKSSNTVLKESVITPNEFASILKGEIAS